MISCPHCREKLSEFLDETLEPNERASVAAHLESCAACAQIARELKNLRLALREIAPVTAPAFLRSNVRAALQNEVKARTWKPNFAWRPAQFTWSGTLALAALTLMIATRPFTPSSVPPAPQIATLETENEKPASPRIETQPAPKPQKIKPQVRLKPAAPNTKIVAQNPADSRSKSAAANEDSTKNEGKILARRETAIGQSPNSVVSSQKSPRATSPVPIFPAASQQKKTPILMQKREEIPSVLAAPPQSDASQLAQRKLPSGTPTATEPRQKTSQIQRSMVRESTPQFVLVLKSVPSVAGNQTPRFRKAAPSLAPSAPVANSTKNEANGASGKAGARFNAPSSAKAARSTNQFDSDAPSTFSAPSIEALESEDLAADSASTLRVVARRFRLQIDAPFQVKAAQVRLELPASLRLLWPASNVVWRGDFTPGKTVDVEFSLSDGRGAEEISVKLEQKTGEAQSKLLQTQTLILPASSE